MFQFQLCLEVCWSLPEVIFHCEVKASFILAGPPSRPPSGPDHCNVCSPPADTGPGHSDRSGHLSLHGLLHTLLQGLLTPTVLILHPPVWQHDSPGRYVPVIDCNLVTFTSSKELLSTSAVSPGTISPPTAPSYGK